MKTLRGQELVWLRKNSKEWQSSMHFGLELTNRLLSTHNSAYFWQKDCGSSWSIFFLWPCLHFLHVMVAHFPGSLSSCLVSRSPLWCLTHLPPPSPSTLFCLVTNPLSLHPPIPHNSLLTPFYLPSLKSCWFTASDRTNNLGLPWDYQ